MTKYEYYINKADFYTREARRQYGKDNAKVTAFYLIAQDCYERARKLKVGEALK